MDVKPGRYHHFKGGLYQVLFTARQTETDEPVVVYLSLTTGEFFVRPERMWAEAVLWPDGKMHPRFSPEAEVVVRDSLCSNLA